MIKPRYLKMRLPARFKRGELNITHWLIAIFISAGVIVGISATNLVSNWKTAEVEQRGVSRSKEALSFILEANLYLSEIEAGLRGFLLSKRDSYLQPYLTGRTRWQHNLLSLEELNKENSAQVSRVNDLQEISGLLFNHYEQLIKSRKFDGLLAVVRIIENAEDKRMMDTLRSGLLAMKRFELDQLSKREKIVKEAWDSFIMSLWILCGSFFVVLVLAFYLSYSILKSQEKQRTRLTYDNWLKDCINELHELNKSGKTPDIYGIDLIEYLTRRFSAIIVNLYTKEDGRFEKICRLDGEKFNNPDYIPNVVQNAIQCKTFTEYLGVEFDKPIVSTGAGNLKIQNLYLQPILYQGSVIAVIEIASNKILTSNELSFLAYMQENLGVSFEAVRSRQKLCELLVDGERYADTLKKQQDKLQEANSDLELRKKLLEEQNKEMAIAKNEIQIKAHELETAGRFKSDFLASMSHELRTPLNSILILSNLLTENEHENLTDKQLGFAKTINRSGRDLLNLIDDVLDLSKVDAGKLSISVTKFDVLDVLEEIESLFKVLAEEKGLSFSMDLSVTGDCIVYSDKNRLKQILRNLLANAIKFTDRGGISIAIRMLSEKEGYIIEVSDTGIGIPEGNLENIFSPFHQGDDEVGKRYGGTGLGLTISQNLSKLLGYKITVESRVGVGSRFSVMIPPNYLLFDDEDLTFQITDIDHTLSLTVPKLLSQGEPTRLLNDRKILLVDDDSRNIFALASALKSKGVTVIIARNGEECLKALNANPEIDLILMDIMMPVMDGYEAIRHIRSIANFQSTPIIALTAKLVNGELGRSLEAGANGYLSKPLEMKKLWSTIDEWLT